jgi:hypothetical protein
MALCLARHRKRAGSLAELFALADGHVAARQNDEFVRTSTMRCSRIFARLLHRRRCTW